MRLNRLFFFLLMFNSVVMLADKTDLRSTFDSANAAYSKADYKKAIALYEEILAYDKESSSLYFNLGNAYMKSNEIGKAILNYERAKKLTPQDEDINNNLTLANQKTEDKIEAAPKLFFAQWENGVTDIVSEKGWSIVFIACIALGFLLITIYVISRHKSFRQFGFFMGITLLIISIPVFFMAASKYENTLNSNTAVILSPSVTVTGAPDEKGTKLFILHEGTKVIVTKTDDDWSEIRIVNGNVGWVKTSVLEKI